MAYSNNTGPKGVIADYKEAKQLEEIRIMEENLQTWEIMEKNSFTIDNQETIGMDKVTKQYTTTKRFGNLYHFSKDDMVEFVDNEPSNISVLIHICNPSLRISQRMDECLDEIAQEIPLVKMGTMLEDPEAREFQDKDLPIFIVYRGGEVYGSHVRLADTLGHNFDIDDVLPFIRQIVK